VKRAPLRRRTPLRRFNPVRQAARRAEQFGPCARMARLLPCCVCSQLPPSDPAHVRSRGAGGKDAANVAPLCRRHHIEQHALGRSALEARCGVSLEVVASYVADLVREHVCHEVPESMRGGAVRCYICRAPIEDQEVTP